MTSQFINKLTKKIRILSWVSFLNSIIFFNAIAHAQTLEKSNTLNSANVSLTLKMPDGQWIFQKNANSSSIYAEKNPIKFGKNPYFLILNVADKSYRTPMYSIDQRKGYYLKSNAYLERFDVDCKTGFLYLNRITFYIGNINQMTEAVSYGKNDNILHMNIVFTNLLDKFGEYEGLNNSEKYLKNLTIMACR